MPSSAMVIVAIDILLSLPCTCIQGMSNPQFHNIYIYKIHDMSNHFP